jgi:triosephosphate isomerase
MGLARPVVLGNWKMNGLRADGVALARAVAERTAGLPATVGVFPPATILAAVAEAVAGTRLLVGGQDCHERPSGAFTGDVAAVMLADCGARAVLVGHSERRHGLGEDDRRVRAKAEAALAAGLLVVVCIGETEAEWQAGRREAVLERQLAASVPAAAPADRLLIAYEPVWAIGTGRSAGEADIAAAHGLVRARLDATSAESAGPGAAVVPVLYGGSVKADNAAAILALPGVDGVLVGGASLDAAGFAAIAAAAPAATTAAATATARAG